jgi:hypothetical protein
VADRDAHFVEAHAGLERPRHERVPRFTIAAILYVLYTFDRSA